MEIVFKDMWHHQIWGQFAGYAAGSAASIVLTGASSASTIVITIATTIVGAQ